MADLRPRRNRSFKRLLQLFVEVSALLLVVSSSEAQLEVIGSQKDTVVVGENHKKVIIIGGSYRKEPIILGVGHKKTIIIGGSYRKEPVALGQKALPEPSPSSAIVPLPKRDEVSPTVMPLPKRDEVSPTVMPLPKRDEVSPTVMPLPKEDNSPLVNSTIELAPPPELEIRNPIKDPGLQNPSDKNSASNDDDASIWNYRGIVVVAAMVSGMLALILYLFKQ